MAKDDLKRHFYGTQAALCVEATVYQDEHKRGQPTVNFEFAEMEKGAKGRTSRKILWENKLIFQLAPSELTAVSAVCLGYLPAFKCGRPGKGFSVERQPNKIYVNASAGKGVFPQLAISMGDTFQLSCLLLHQLKAQTPWLDENCILASVRGAAGLYKPEPKN